MSIAHDVTAEEIERSLAAISRHPKGAGEIVRPPGEAYSLTAPDGRYIYVNFVRPADVPIGAIYRTWIAHLAEGKVVRVMYFRSRRGAFADDTLPDDD